jgi:homoserine dehydrogenase
MNTSRNLVLKFGSSILRSDADFTRAAVEVRRRVRRGERVVAVVSATLRTTESLLTRSRDVSGCVEETALAALLSTGEAASGALLALALAETRLPAALLDPLRAGLTTRGPRLDADPAGLDVPLLMGLLADHGAVVVPGFYGAGDGGGVALLGRGGSDLTALHIARVIGARCRLLKDVGGVFDGDPASHEARRYAELSWDDARRLCGRVVQDKALAYAKEHRLEFEVGALGDEDGTLVGVGPTRLEYPETTPSEVGSADREAVERKKRNTPDGFLGYDAVAS